MKASSSTASGFERLERKAPALVVGTLVDGKRDVAVLGGGTEAARDSIFEIGSITKTFTALVLASMVDRGEVALSDPVSKFGLVVPEGVRSREITLLDLATHTARLPGVPRDLRWKALRDSSNPYADYDYARLDAALMGLRKRSRIGEKSRYSNFGFAVLGRALEKAAGVSYEELVQVRVCEPLNLRDTFSDPTPDQVRRYLPGHKKKGSPVPHWDLASFGPAGALKSTIDDMLTYLEDHLEPEGQPLGAALREVQTSHFAMKKGRLEIGLAWMLVMRRGNTIVWHNGGTGGFSSFVGFDPRARVGVAALANARVAGPLTRLGLKKLQDLTD